VHTKENAVMRLYMHPASATSRPISLFAVDEHISLEEVVIDLMAGEHRLPEYLAINPNGLVPLLDDGGFRLTESSAILKYLAEKTSSAAYPRDLRERARVNETMDWLNANLYRDLGFNMVYPQIFPHHARRSAEGTAAAVAWGTKRSEDWMRVLDGHLIGPNANHLCLGRLTIADYLGSGLVGLAEAVGFAFSDYPNVDRWLRNMKSMPNWERVNGGFYRMLEASAA
jgi:glutathione S-transferase